MSFDKAYDHCFDLVRRTDKERFVAGLFAPQDRRRHLYALYAFYAETAAVRDRVSDPLPGEIRLQWWHDAITGTCRGEIEGNPLAVALLDTIERFDLPRNIFAEMLEARSFDLYDDPMPSLDDLHAYARETASALIRLAVRILCGRCRLDVTEVANHAGIAQTVTEVLRKFPQDAARGQIFLPLDVLSRHGVDCVSVCAGEAGEGLMPAMAELRDEVRYHLDETRGGIVRLSPDIAPAFLTTCLVERYLGIMERPGYDPFATMVDMPLWRRHWMLWRMAAKARRHYAA
ncbi:phytoene synthase [Rhodobium orientis]|uniref:Phytoene/squalene synthase family protein n=1 Tax=Rhodobium orientis TaxID=34017 RepID=A0A327JRA5_9HYPH|nr:phytoene/squalene synthase family protein [Rhodobium orientis]MBB4302158.1 phytoene synthase [Rhodobium orientis]MBK5948869.1 hypothetical protein [Rhodobium orientis]RAI27943.1 hypothetical protein CH339_08555 [Rhodobium orientis]